MDGADLTPMAATLSLTEIAPGTRNDMMRHLHFYEMIGKMHFASIGARWGVATL
jgi:hypothetical protein